MEPRIDYSRVAPGALEVMLGLERYTRHSGLEPGLLDLIRVRASQINGCAYCLDMHTKDARLRGETEQRLYALSAWKETPFYTARERAALAWTEVVTRIATTGISGEAYEAARREFSEKELVDLTIAVIAINGWNRLAVGFGTVPGSYQPVAAAHAQAR